MSDTMANLKASGGLKPNQIAWCDTNLCGGKYRDYRLQAEAAARDTDRSRRAMAKPNKRRQS